MQQLLPATSLAFSAAAAVAAAALMAPFELNAHQLRRIGPECN